MSDKIELSFEDFEDLQTRLVLLPRIEHQGVGAVVAEAYPDRNVIGYELYGLLLRDDTLVECRDRPFSNLLSLIRDAPPPIVICVTPPSDEGSDEDSDDAEEEKKTDPLDKAGNPESASVNVEHTQANVHHAAETPSPHEVPVPRAATTATTTTTSPAFPNKRLDFSFWTSRMKETSAQLAAGAALGAEKLATVAKEVATSKELRSKREATTNNTTATTAQEEQDDVRASIHIQASSGAWLPLTSSLTPTTTTTTSLDLQLTNSSVIAVRRSETEACDNNSTTFQWFRSNNSTDEWERLEGANYAVFQPSAAEIGFRLRCIVVKEGSHDIHVCETDVVSAAGPLFNGSRQALARGAQFSGLQGRGKLDGRSFLIKVGMTRSSAQRPTTSAVIIYQISGNTAEPMHAEDQPLVGVTAECDYGNAKAFALVFDTIPDSASMVKALATNQRFELVASNRLARESLMLTLGIANYVGKPMELRATTVLYDSPAKVPPCIECAGNEPDLVARITTSTSVDTPIKTPDPLSEQRSIPLSPSPSADTIIHKRSRSLDQTDHAARINELIDELTLVRTRLDGKSKVFSELQRHVGTMETALSESNAKAATCGKMLQQKETEKQNLQETLRLTEKRVAQQEKEIERAKQSGDAKAASIQVKLNKQSETIAELEKSVRTMQNEKAILSATVEARESKLGKMATLQQSFDDLSDRIAENEALRKAAAHAQQRYQDKCAEVDHATEATKKLEALLLESNSKLESLAKELEEARSASSCHQAELEAQQLSIQKLMAERNSYKQKGDSLSKEIGRVCRNGRTIRDVEKIIADDMSRRQEVELLREQKQKALEDLEYYRNSFEQSRNAQMMAGLDHDSAKVLERNAELERLLSELTEYLNAKEMQLETLKQVNTSLQAEIIHSTRASLSRNLDDGDV